MTHVPHSLAEEFPDDANAISLLRENDRHFAQLVDTYHVMNKAVHRAETNIEPISPEAETVLRKRRAALKDEIWSTLRAQRTS